MKRTVTAPDGRTWTVKRRWLPRRRRLWRMGADDALDGGNLLDFGSLTGIVIGIVAVIVLLVLLNVVAIALELLLALIIVGGGLFGRVVLRRPWMVEARTEDVAHAWPVVGWRPSAAKIDDVSERLRSGAQFDPAGGHWR